MFSLFMLSIAVRFSFVFGDASKDTGGVDYCSHPDCSIKNQHTMCIAADKQSSRLYASGITTWMRHQILLLHNRYRDNIAMGLEAGQPPATNMRKMYWDYELEESAELWARQCQKRHDECRNTIRFNVLQNMDVRPVTPRLTEAQLLTDAVGSWYSGSRAMPQEHVWSFRLGNCSGSGGCNSHWYAAAAWASTWRLGCSQSLCTLGARSCSRFRIKRRSNEIKNTTRTTLPSTENILRRTKVMTTNDIPHFEDITATLGTLKNPKSPLHRGIANLDGTKTKKRKELKIVAITICNYGPAGNIDGFPIYDTGPTCTNCPPGTQCGDKTHRGLCSFLDDPMN